MKPKPEIDNFLKIMTPQLISKFQNILSDKDLEPLPLTQAINGSPITQVDPMNLKSSPGIPWNKKYNSKKNLMLKDGHCVWTGKTLYKLPSNIVDIVDNKLTLAAEGKRTLSIWKDCLKDETRPLDKVAIGKTRVFSCAPLDSCIAFRIMFGAFKHAWQLARSKLFHSVGVNPLSGEWSLMYKAMLSKSTTGIDADFGRFDGNLRQEFMIAARDIIVETILAALSPEEWDIDTLRVQYQTIFNECIWTVQQSENTVYMSNHGNPSGNPLTTQVNCIVNLLYHLYCFHRITGSDSLATFEQETYFTCLGDDAVWVFVPSDTMNFKNIQKIMVEELEQDYTTASKSQIGAQLPLNQLSFLKRNFDDTYSYTMAPLEKDSIEQQFNYCMYKPEALDILQVCVENALEEASLHGSGYYQTFSSKLVKAFNKHAKSVNTLFNPITPLTFNCQKGVMIDKMI
jgi:hypothetical protein